MPFKANDSLTEQIAQHLGKLIIQGTLAPAERIQELRIAAELDVSRGSVREALLILQRRHLVEIYPRRGAVVASLTQEDVRAFFELWFLLLNRAATNLALSWKNDDLARFFALEAELAEHKLHADFNAFFDTSFIFLQTLYDFAGNRYLEDALNNLQPMTQRCLYAIFRSGDMQLERAQCFISDLLKAIIARDLTRLNSVTQHLSDTYRALVQEATATLAKA
ncbi:GntR family transcriptional regulator [Craterilacuibacter sp. RT1T]|uniref:GntR family transcriptional regulator n=1 Tax=Craterilacuibacter sp. RT1T TaxID=2942211 RepID=UPI0020BE5656|nr:GntR family transcriptional regulator [Craterilacuibacter sp. RT1T]MCL6262064.1 GntR family transcriptional regulator [Craterilacuibacter sp. RT1T]